MLFHHQRDATAHPVDEIRPPDHEGEAAMLVEVRQLRQTVQLTPAVLLPVGVGDLDAKEDRFLMDAEGLDRPERSAGSGSIEPGADPGGFMRGGLVEELIEPIRRLSDREDAGSLLLRRHRAIQAAERDLIGETIERGS
jgi:hypothetical protein